MPLPHNQLPLPVLPLKAQRPQPLMLPLLVQLLLSLLTPLLALQLSLQRLLQQLLPQVLLARRQQAPQQQLVALFIANLLLPVGQLNCGLPL
jgi:hypothetical protein